MDSNLEHALTKLAQGTLLRIEGGQGQAVAVFRGLVWITQDNDLRDVIIGDGESFTLDRPGLAIVQALRDSSLLLIERSGTPGEGAGPGSPRITAYQLEARARQLRVQAFADAASWLATLPRRLWTRLAARPATSSQH